MTNFRFACFCNLILSTLVNPVMGQVLEPRLSVEIILEEPSESTLFLRPGEISEFSLQLTNREPEALSAFHLTFETSERTSEVVEYEFRSLTPAICGELSNLPTRLLSRYRLDLPGLIGSQEILVCRFQAMRSADSTSDINLTIGQLCGHANTTVCGGPNLSVGYLPDRKLTMSLESQVFIGTTDVLVRLTVTNPSPFPTYLNVSSCLHELSPFEVRVPNHPEACSPDGRTPRCLPFIDAWAVNLGVAPAHTPVNCLLSLHFREPLTLPYYFAGQITNAATVGASVIDSDPYNNLALLALTPEALPVPNLGSSAAIVLLIIFFILPIWIRRVELFAA